MSRYLAIRTKNEVFFLKVSKNSRPLTTWKGRLYRTDERLMIPDHTGKMEFVMYDIDGTQPYGQGRRLDPDETMALIDIAKTNPKGGSVTKLDFLNSINKNYLLYGVIGIVIIYALLTGGGAI